eukprot:TRINITY_DN17317_c0_g2_i2.p1 TRINITY_DN17317_c0_g2~~TRINITY_DN17317_c0_g2_i2.p1  ORF type:complete len:226 (+),score=44.03 TRINITY_DN17317_c0_g2_i2:93-770(+)
MALSSCLLRKNQQVHLQVVVTALIVWYGILVTQLFAPNSASRGSAWCLRQQVFASFEVVIVLHCLWSCTLTDAGKVDRGWNGSLDKPLVPGYAWCAKCNDFKAPRTHHCSHCKRCVAKFDHHCDWIDNCVGERNHKNFVLFLFYVFICILHYFFSLGLFLFEPDPEVLTPSGRPRRFGAIRRRLAGDGETPAWIAVTCAAAAGCPRGGPSASFCSRCTRWSRLAC